MRARLLEDFLRKLHGKERMQEEPFGMSSPLLRVMFEQSSLLMGLLKPDGTVLAANATAYSFIDASESDVIGRLFWETPWWAHSPGQQQRLRAKLENLHIGQNVLFTLDTYPGVTFTGKIMTLGSNTASTFSLIPANNASGNFTKVTQRVQLKISIDGTTDGKKASEYRILSGMSALVKIVRE